MSEKLNTYVHTLETKETSPTQKAKKGIEEMKLQVNKEQKTILYLTYLTTLARLKENRDLDELFDGEIQLGEEEMFAIYSLIEIVNGSNYLSTLKAPKSMELERNFAQDYTYKLDYEDHYFLDGKEINANEVSKLSKDKKNKIQIKRLIKSIEGDGSLPLNETNLIFNYDSKLNIKGMKFERPTNGFEGGGLGIDQNISLSRNNEGLVNNISILRKLEIDNSLSISYNSFGKPEIIEQTKLGLISDKIVFEYDDNGDLTSIIYIPALSIKHLKGTKKAFNSGNKFGGLSKGLQLSGEYITFETLKKMKGNDTIIINNKNGLPNSTKTNLNASRWFYRKGFSKFNYGDNNISLRSLYLEKEDLGPDDKKTIKLKY